MKSTGGSIKVSDFLSDFWGVLQRVHGVSAHGFQACTELKRGKGNHGILQIGKKMKTRGRFWAELKD